MATEIEKRKEFLKELINFFKGTVCGSADSVKALVKIEENYPDLYKKLKEVKFDPNQINELMKSMTEKEKDVFFIVFTKASILGRKLTMIFDMSLEEKKTLVKELDDYAEEIDTRLKELVDEIK